MKRKTLPIIIVVIILAMIVVLGMNSFSQVPTGHTGVVTTFGKVESYVLGEGIHAKLPWQKVIKMDNRAQKASLMLQAFSSDIQQVEVACAVNFSIDRETSQNLYRNVGSDYYKVVMEPRINENLKAIFTKFNADSLVEHREELSARIEDLLKPEMKTYGIEIINVSIENIDFTDVFTDAVEKKQVAEQSKLQAQIEQDQKVMEEQKTAERIVIAAEAAAEVKKIEADAEAYSIEIQAKAEAEANQKIATSLTKELIEYVQANNWDGALPQYFGSTSTGVIPILDVTETTN